MTRGDWMKRAKFVTDAIAGNHEPWTGAVERRPRRSYRERSLHYTWRCQAPHCRQWTMRDAWRYGRCNWCSTPRPANDPGNPLTAPEPRSSYANANGDILPVVRRSSSLK